MNKIKQIVEVDGQHYEVVLDLDMIAWMFDRARKNKKGVSIEAGGALKVRVVK